MFVSLRWCRKYNSGINLESDTSGASWRGVEPVYTGIMMLCIATRVFNMEVKRCSWGCSCFSGVEKEMRGIHVIVPLMVGCVMSDIVTAVKRGTWEAFWLFFSFFCARASEFDCGGYRTVEENDDLGGRWKTEGGVVEQEGSDDGGENCDARIFFFCLLDQSALTAVKHRWQPLLPNDRETYLP